MESALDILANMALGTGTLDDQGPSVGILGPPSSPNGGGSSDAERGGFPREREKCVLESRGAFIVCLLTPISVHSLQIYMPPTYFLSLSARILLALILCNYQDPVSAPSTALTIQHEKMRVSEALAARDAVVHHLELACRSVREKAVTIEELRSEKEHLEGRLEELNGGAARKGARGGDARGRYNDTGAGEVDGLRSDGKNESTSSQAEVDRLKGVIVNLQVELQELKDRTLKSGVPTIDREQPPLAYEDQAVSSTVSFLMVISRYTLGFFVSLVLLLLQSLRPSHLCPHLVSMSGSACWLSALSLNFSIHAMLRMQSMLLCRPSLSGTLSDQGGGLVALSWFPGSSSTPNARGLIRIWPSPYRTQPAPRKAGLFQLAHCLPLAKFTKGTRVLSEYFISTRNADFVSLCETCRNFGLE